MESFVFGVANSGHRIAGTLLVGHATGSNVLSGGVGRETSMYTFVLLATTVVVLALRLRSKR